MKNVLNNISSEQADQILRQLWDKGGAIRESIIAEAEKVLSVDADQIAGDILFALDSLDVRELWRKSGPNRHGYVSPDEMAYEMIEEELSPFHDQIDKYHKLGMYEEEKLYCMGVLKGLYLFEKNGKSEFRDWAVDIPGELFESVLGRWRKHTRSRKQKSEMDDFIRVMCPEWAKRCCKGMD